MKFNIFGRMHLLVEKKWDKWAVYYLGNEGKKRKAEDISIPGYIDVHDVKAYLEDLFHEYATEKFPEIVEY